MNARKVLFILGGIAAAVIAAIIAFSLFTLHKVVGDKNRSKTEKARENRWRKKEETEASNLTVTSNGIEEQPKPEDNATGESQSDDEKTD